MIFACKNIGVVLDVVLLILPANNHKSVIYSTKKMYHFDLSHLYNLGLSTNSISLSQKNPKTFCRWRGQSEQENKKKRR